VDSTGARRSSRGTFTGGRQLNAWSVRRRKKTLRTRLADALLAALASWALPLAYLVFSGPTFDSSGEPDNAPYLAKGALVFLTPVILALLVAYYFSVQFIFSRLRLASLPFLLIAAAVAGAIVGIAIYRGEAPSSGSAFAAQQGAAIGGLLFLVLTTGELARWLLVRRLTRHWS
jgi:di/tricarboxylate transporter